MPLGSKMAQPRGSLAIIDLQWEKHKKNLLLRNHKALSFHILYVAMYSGPLYKSCQPCPWGPYGPSFRGRHGKNFKKILLQNHKAQSFHILCVTIYSGPLYKSCQPCPWGPYGPAPGGSWVKHEKKSSLKPQGPELS